MAQPSLILGQGSWAVKVSSSLAYSINDEEGYFQPVPLLVSRSLSASYIDSNGYIQTIPPQVPRVTYVRTDRTSVSLLEPRRINLCLNSEDFANAGWAKTGVTATSNQIPGPYLDPSNQNTAELVTATAGTATIRQIGRASVTAVAGTSYTFSVYAKEVTQDLIQMSLGSAVFASSFVNFNLETGTTVHSGSTGALPTGNIEHVGNGWYRCSITATAAASATSPFNISLIPLATSPIASTSTLATSIFLWGGQIEAGHYASSFIPTTTTAVTRNQETINTTGISDLIGQTEGTLYIQYAPVSTKLPATPSNEDILRISSANDQSIIALYLNTKVVGAYGNVPHIAVELTRIGQATATHHTRNTPLTHTNLIKLAVVYKTNSLYIYENGVLVYENNSTDVIFPLPNTFSKLGIGPSLNLNFQGASIGGVMLYKTALSYEECVSLTAD